MAFIGQIEGASGSNGIDKDSWIRLIDSHPQLSVVPPQKGINPFTRKPIEFKALPTSAIVCIGGEEIGLISWRRMVRRPLLWRLTTNQRMPSRACARVGDRSRGHIYSMDQ